MDLNISTKLREYNRIFKEMDRLYREIAKRMGLSNGTFWALYALRESEAALTQATLCDSWYFSKQTLNSTLKTLEKSGLVCLLPDKNNKKNKLVCLTSQGVDFCKKTIDLVFEAEDTALNSLTEEGPGNYISLNNAHIFSLSRELDKRFK